MSRPLLWLHRLTGERFVPLHDVANLVIEERLGDLETMKFTVRARDAKAGLLAADQLVGFDGRLYRVEELVQQRDGATPVIEAYCEARWMDLAKRARPGVFSVLARTPLQGLTQILAGSGWSVGSVPSDSTLVSFEGMDETVLSLVRQWARLCGYEVLFDTEALTVSLVEQLGADRGIGFRWGHNVRNVLRRYRPPAATRLYAYGANNLSIEQVNPDAVQYVEDYSWYLAQGLSLPEARALFRKDQVWVDNRYLLGLNLFDAARRRIARLAQPTISYELTVVDLARLTASPADDVAVGDMVRVRDEDFGVDVSTRVVRRVRYPLNPSQDQAELEYLQPGLAEVENSTESRSINYAALNVVLDENADEFALGSTPVDYATMAVTVAGEATAVTGSTFAGVASGSGVAEFQLIIDSVGEGPVYEVSFDNGDQVEFSWPSYATGIQEGSILISFRCRVASGAGTILVAAGHARSWVLLRGAVGIGVNLSPNQRLVEVLDDIGELDDLPADSISITLHDAIDIEPGETLPDIGVLDPVVDDFAATAANTPRGTPEGDTRVTTDGDTRVADAPLF